MIFTREHAISLCFVSRNLLRLVPCKRSLSLLMALAMLLFAGSVQAQQTFTFTFTGGVQTFVVPAGVTLLQVDAFGAQGGQGDALGGKGGRIETTIVVTPGETLSLIVGGAGGNSGGSGQPGPGGFNGGGDGGRGNSFFSPTGAFFGGGGGGASDIRRGGTTLANRIVVAGGGGGGGIGGDIVGPGGAGGDTQAAPGANADGAQGGDEGTQLAGGTGGVSTTGGTTGANGSLGIGGQGGGGNSNSRGGGGGGSGYFGGGGGGGGNTLGGGGGGGGSSFSSGTDIIHTAGFQTGNGMIVLTVVTICNPPTDIFANNTGAVGLAEAVVSNLGLDNCKFEGDVRIANFLRFWMGVLSIKVNPLGTGELIADGAAPIEGRWAEIGIIPACEAGFSIQPPFVNCVSPRHAAWVTSFSSPGTITVELARTRA